MTGSGVVPEGEALRRAVRWLSEHRPITASRVNDAAERFDLSPLEEEFLLREFCAGRLPPRPRKGTGA